MKLFVTVLAATALAACANDSVRRNPERVHFADDNPHTYDAYATYHTNDNYGTTEASYAWINDANARTVSLKVNGMTSGAASPPEVRSALSTVYGIEPDDVYIDYLANTATVNITGTTVTPTDLIGALEGTPYSAYAL